MEGTLHSAPAPIRILELLPEHLLLLEVAPEAECLQESLALPPKGTSASLLGCSQTNGTTAVPPVLALAASDSEAGITSFSWNDTDDSERFPPSGDPSRLRPPRRRPGERDLLLEAFVKAVTGGAATCC